MGELARTDHPTVSGVTALLKANMKGIQSALPRHMTPERMCRVALNTIRRTPQLLKCAPETLVSAIVEASSLGLEIDMRGQAYLVPFFNRKTQTTDVTLIPGFKGLMDLAYRSGRVTSIYAEIVCENDNFDFAMGLEQKLVHVPNLGDRGDMKAVYAVAKVKDADPAVVVLGKTEIEKIKRASRAADSGPWKDWEEEMWKKTAIRRLCKYLPLSPEMQRAVALDEAADAGIGQPLAEAVIDVHPVHGGDDTPGLSSALGKKSEASPAPSDPSPGTAQAQDIAQGQDVSNTTDIPTMAALIKALGTHDVAQGDIKRVLGRDDLSNATDDQRADLNARLERLRGGDNPADVFPVAG